MLKRRWYLLECRAQSKEGAKYWRLVLTRRQYWRGIGAQKRTTLIAGWCPKLGDTYCRVNLTRKLFSNIWDGVPTNLTTYSFCNICGIYNTDFNISNFLFHILFCFAVLFIFLGRLFSTILEDVVRIRSFTRRKRLTQQQKLRAESRSIR